MWRWKSRLRNAASIGVGDKLILFDERGRLAAVRIRPDGHEPGSMTARGMLSGRCFSAPALSGGLLYVRNEEELRCLHLRGPKGQALQTSILAGGQRVVADGATTGQD